MNLTNPSTICFQLVKVADRGESPTRWGPHRPGPPAGPFRWRLSQRQAIPWIILLIGRRIESVLSQIWHYCEFYFCLPIQHHLFFVEICSTSPDLCIFVLFLNYSTPTQNWGTTTTVNRIPPPLAHAIPRGFLHRPMSTIWCSQLLTRTAERWLIHASFLAVSTSASQIPVRMMKILYQELLT